MGGVSSPAGNLALMTGTYSSGYAACLIYARTQLSSIAQSSQSSPLKAHNSMLTPLKAHSTLLTAHSSPLKAHLPADLQHLTRCVAQALRTVRCDDDIVFNTYSAAAAQIDARFNREDHARLQLHVVPCTDIRLLVRLQAKPVPCPVDEVFSVSGSFNHTPRRGVDIAGSHARNSHGTTGGVRLSDDFGNIRQFARDLPNRIHTGEIRHIAVDIGAPVDQHELILLERSVPR